MKQKMPLVCLFLSVCLTISAQIRLPRLVRDSMVLQRDTKINVWGWAGKGERVRVKFNGKTYKSGAGQDGKWMLQLPAMKAGGPYSMEISGRNKIILHDILIGDVWLCSGQSNMVHQMKLHSVRYPDEIAGAHYPEIRQFWVPTLTDLQGPKDDLPAGNWKSANPVDVLEFSAVAYFFSRDLYEKYHIPIGIINASVGGTPIEAWTSEEGFRHFPAILKTIEKNKDTAYVNDPGRKRLANMRDMPRPMDKGLEGAVPWYSTAYLPKGWRSIGIPGYWEDQGLKNLDGVVWYRREIDVPASMTGKPAKVFLGRIVDADALYINGKEVGNTTYEYPQRRYAVPSGLLKPGKNLFVVRVTNTVGKGGFVPDKPYCLIAGNDTVDLKGYWEYKVGEVFVPRGGAGSGFPFSAQNAPSALYNSMIAPLIHYAIKGFVWYQGEANTNNAAGYARLQPAMIADWRHQWKEGDIPFLYVQLPGFGDYNYLPAESGWAELREAQLRSLTVPNTGMVVAIDLGEWNDIHPDRKKPVGERLALAAQKIAYGDDTVYSGPIFQSAAFTRDKVIISFAHTGGGLMTMDGEEPQEFAIAGADKKFVWACAKIEGEKVVVWSDEIKEPKYVRYAWADDPVNPNLYNKEGLPASPFETVQDANSLTAQQDHDDMMRQLGITALRPGPSGDANAPNHANYDERQANPCPRAQTGHELWLSGEKGTPVTVVCSKSSPTLDIAREELKKGWQGEPGAAVILIIKKDKALKEDGFRLGGNRIQANTDIGVLYGVYELLRRQRTGESVAAEACNPSYRVRLLDHWDNLNGTIERGYAGNSIFWRTDEPFTVTDADRKLWQEYARANASIGINGAVLNNVNASPQVLTADYLARAKAIADVLRPYGVKAYLSVNFASPALIGGLKTADPLDPAVIAWWKSKVKEIYNIIPDLGGFLVKASSEGQPGPQQYGRSHAEGANMLADALKPFGGIVMWRAFVYAANDNDRARQAYSEFVPMDGKFRDNVIIQVKNGPVDFQPREPFSPLFGALKKTAVMPEFQVTQEYLGHSVYLVFLSTMWEECLKSDTYQQGEGSTVARCTDGSIYPQKYTAIAGVANVGLDTNWCGYLFSQANWYAFGRLAWDDTASSSRIADEWLKLTFYNDSLRKRGNWDDRFLTPVRRMMLDSREAAVNFMMPLGLHHIMSANGHYGPGPWWSPAKVRPDWTPRYYHQADANGIGFDRTTKGSDAVSQYHEPLASEFNNAAACPEKYLLWFHHLPWDYKMKNGQSLWDALCHHWDLGVRQVREFQKTWDSVQPFLDSVRFTMVQHKLREQCANAILWRDACLLYFQPFSRLSIPDDIDRPVYELDAIIAHEFDHRIQ